MKPPKRTPITVNRKINRHGNHYWYFQNGRRFIMDENLALAAARRGEVKIRTEGDGKSC